LKVNFGDDLRRISVADDCSYADLRKTLQSLFHKSLPSGFIIKYKDEESDVLSITSDSELQEAKTIHKQLLRLTLIAPPTGEKSNEKPESATDNVKPKEAQAQSPSLATPQANQLNFAPLLQELMQNTQLAQSMLPLVMSALGNSFQAQSGTGGINPNPSPQDPQASIQKLSEKLLSESCIQNLLSSVLPLAAQQAQNAAQHAAQAIKRHADQTTTATPQTDKPCEIVTVFDPLPPTSPESPTTTLVATSDPVVDPVTEPAPSTTVYVPSPEPENESEPESDSETNTPILISTSDPVHISIDGGEAVAKDNEDKKINDLAYMFAAPLAQLADLGFTDRFVNVSLLQRYNGDISLVLDALLDA